jgi:hypothetical protein
LRSRICDRTTTLRGRLAHQTFYGHVEFGTHFNLPAAQPAGQHICPEAQSASAIHAPHEDSAAARIELIGDCDFESLPALNARYSLIATCDNVICSLTAWLPANVRIATTTTATARSNLYMTTSLMMPIHHVSQPSSNPRIVDFLPLATDYAHIKVCQLHQIPQICQLPTNSSHNGFQKILGIAVATMLDVRQAQCLGTICAIQAQSVATLRACRESDIGTNRRLAVGQSMSALPRYFRHPLVPLLPKHRPPRCQDI